MTEAADHSENGEKSVQRPRKILVVVDETQECRVAVQYAALRARMTGARVVMLSAIPKAEFQHWMAIEDLMREEAEEEAYVRLRDLGKQVRDISGAEPEIIIRDGPVREAVISVISEDGEIRVLFLAAGTDKEGPGPLVSSISTQLARDFPIPVLVVPGFLSFEELEELAGSAP